MEYAVYTSVGLWGLLDVVLKVDGGSRFRVPSCRLDSG